MLCVCVCVFVCVRIRHQGRQCLSCVCTGETLGVPIHVFGPETHMTSIVSMALGKKSVPPQAKQQATTANFLLPGAQVTSKAIVRFEYFISRTKPVKTNHSLITLCHAQMSVATVKFISFKRN